MAKRLIMDDPSAFRRQVRMAAVQVAGLKPSELEAALAYEVEPLSGIPAAEAELGYRVIADDDPTVCVYEVAVRRRAAKGGADGARWLRPLMVAGAAVVLLVVADAVYTGWSLTTLGKEVARSEQLDAQIKSVRRVAQTKRDEANEIRARREAAVKTQDEVARLRAAWPELMKAIADSCGRGVVLREMAADGQFRLRLSATAVSAKAASDMMVALSSAAAKLKWTFRPGSTAVKAPGSTVVFDCELRYD